MSQLSDVSVPSRPASSPLFAQDRLGNRVNFGNRTKYNVTGVDPYQEWYLEEWNGVTEMFPTPHVISSKLIPEFHREMVNEHMPALDIDYQVDVFSHTEDAFSLTFPLNPNLSKQDVQTGMAAFLDFGICDGVRARYRGESNVLVVDFGIRVKAHLVASSTQGHNHLYINKLLKWSDYRDCLEFLAEARIISQPYCEFSVKRGQSYLRYPGVTKAQLASPPSTPPVQQPESQVPHFVGQPFAGQPFQTPPSSYMPSRS